MWFHIFCKNRKVIYFASAQLMLISRYSNEHILQGDLPVVLDLPVSCTYPTPGGSVACAPQTTFGAPLLYRNRAVETDPALSSCMSCVTVDGPHNWTSSVFSFPSVEATAHYYLVKIIWDWMWMFISGQGTVLSAWSTIGTITSEPTLITSTL